MNADLKRRVASLEGGYSGLILEGWTILDETGALYGVGTYYDEPDPDLAAWLKTFTPKLESIAVILFTSYPDPDRTHEYTVSADELHPEVKKLLTPYLTPGAQLHIVDGERGDLDDG